MSKELQQKLDPRCRHQLESGKLSGKVGVLIHTRRPLNPDQKQQIKDAGYTLASMMGTILTGIVADTKNLESVAQLPFVSQIELSSPMFQEA